MQENTEETGTVYLARCMPVDESEPIYAFRVGETIRAAMAAIEDAVASRCPPRTLHNLEWEMHTDTATRRAATARRDSWKFQVDEYEVATEGDIERTPDIHSPNPQS